MKTKLFVATFVALSAIGASAYAGEDDDATKTGLIGGATTGAVVGGPVGAVVGGVVGATTGAVIDDANKPKEKVIIEEHHEQPSTTVIQE